jgi:hypothetical protein
MNADLALYLAAYATGDAQHAHAVARTYWGAEADASEDAEASARTYAGGFAHSME